MIAAHDAEAARIAAEQAAAAAAAASRRSGTARSGGGGGGGGGGGAPSNAVLSATNAQRAANGVAALAWSGTLASYSCSWAARLAASDSGLSHSSFPGGFNRWGENVAYGYGSASAVVNAWMNSEGHRANILDRRFTSMGACSATAASGTIYWVQQFGG
ncbi:MAG: CAP domain-containing protein [Microbacteriaceae bacterium]|nr:MAG: CAP domain-containing protein [Microbacteriaceae bacterium]